MLLYFFFLLIAITHGMDQVLLLYLFPINVGFWIFQLQNKIKITKIDFLFLKLKYLIESSNKCVIN